MQLNDFNFNLPDQLIARYPLEERTASRLLCLNGTTGAIKHSIFADIAENLNAGDLLVFNNTRVIPARLNGHKTSGGKVEVLIERLISSNTALAQIRASKSPKPESKIILDDQSELTVTGRKDNLFLIKANEGVDLFSIIENIGHMPLPPYIDRPDEDSDKERYQTVYSKHKGAVAAPTAGLHFSENLIDELEKQGIETAFVTLHVGAGTFQPVRVDDITEHTMHSEWFDVDDELVKKVVETKARGGRVIAVGTTSVRCLESAAASGELTSHRGDTNIFIYPGYQFKIVDALITNFHLPESTLIMLVSAFAGTEHVMNAYEEAVNEAYRFFSYGDAMFITKSIPQPINRSDKEKEGN